MSVQLLIVYKVNNEITSPPTVQSDSDSDSVTKVNNCKSAHTQRSSSRKKCTLKKVMYSAQNNVQDLGEKRIISDSDKNRKNPKKSKKCIRSILFLSALVWEILLLVIFIANNCFFYQIMNTC